MTGINLAQDQDAAMGRLQAALPDVNDVDEEVA